MKNLNEQLNRMVILMECSPPGNTPLQMLQKQLPEGYLATEDLPKEGDEFVALCPQEEEGLKHLGIYLAERLKGEYVNETRGTDYHVFTNEGKNNIFINYTRKVIRKK